MQTPTGALLGTGYLVPEEEQARPQRRTREESYAALVARLSHQSVVKHFDAYADIPWDSPGVSHRPRRSALGAAAGRRARRHRVVPEPGTGRYAPASAST